MNDKDIEKCYQKAKKSILKKIGYSTIDINDHEDILQNAALALLRNNKSLDLLSRKSKFELLEVFRTNVYGRGKNPKPKRMLNNYEHDEDSNNREIFSETPSEFLSEDDVQYLKNKYRLDDIDIDIILKIESGYSMKEVADIHTLTPAAISNRVKKIKAKLNNEILWNKNRI